MYLAVVILLLKLAEGIVTYLNNRELITAGEMRAMGSMQEKVLKRVEKANRIRHADRDSAATEQWLRKPEDRHK